MPFGFKGFFGRGKVVMQCPICKDACTLDPISQLHYCPRCDQVTAWLPENSSYIITGGPGTGKTIFTYKLTELYLRNNAPCVHIQLDEMATKARVSLSRFVKGLVDMEARGLFVLLDGYSCIAGVPSSEKRYLKNVADLNELNLQLTSILNELHGAKPTTVFLDSATSMFAHSEVESVLRFLIAAAAKVKGRGGSFFFTLGEGVIGEEPRRRLDQIVDGLLEMRVTQQDGKSLREFRVAKIRGRQLYQDWFPYYIGSETISIGLPTDPKKVGQLKREMQGLVA